MVFGFSVVYTSAVVNNDDIWNNVNNIITTSGNGGTPATPLNTYSQNGSINSSNGNIQISSGLSNNELQGTPISNGYTDFSTYNQGQNGQIGQPGQMGPNPINSPVITPRAMVEQSGPPISAACGISAAEDKWNYCMLAPVGGLIGQPSGGSGKDAMELVVIGDGLQPFFAKLYMLGITVAIALAIVMISFGGIRLATTDSIGGTEEGKKMVNAAFAGLFLALFSYVLLYTINPALLGNGVDDIFKTTTPAQTTTNQTNR